ncbi:hypothetical protein C5C27_16980 [Rathayibacter sp. AY2B7]|nr:hypothetical protein C5C27_16980 [Rathayibacter sp. AY2B7]PPH64094.1 hypothetical protein C5D25_06090 [Rathayibacter sp. AY1D7]
MEPGCSWLPMKKASRLARCATSAVAAAASSATRIRRPVPGARPRFGAIVEAAVGVSGVDAGVESEGTR